MSVTVDVYSCNELKTFENWGKCLMGCLDAFPRGQKTFEKICIYRVQCLKKKKMFVWCYFANVHCHLHFSFNRLFFPTSNGVTQVATINSLIILVSYVWSLCYEDIEYSNSWYKLNCTVWYWCYIPSQPQYNILNKQHKFPSFPILAASKSYRIKK